MAVVRHHVSAPSGIERAVRCAQPPARDEISKRIETFAPVVRRLGELIGELDEEIGVARRRRCVENKLDGPGNFEIGVERRGRERQYAARSVKAGGRPGGAKSDHTGYPTGIGILIRRRGHSGYRLLRQAAIVQGIYAAGQRATEIPARIPDAGWWA